MDCDEIDLVELTDRNSNRENADNQSKKKDELG